MATPGPIARSAIRSRIAEAISIALKDAGWKESRYHIDLLGADVRSRVHLSYAVGIQATAPTQLDRQRPSVGTVATTGVEVSFLHFIKADAQRADYDAALDAGDALVAAVLAVDKDPGLSVTLARYAGQGLIGDGTYLRTDVVFNVLHRLALA